MLHTIFAFWTIGGFIIFSQLPTPVDRSAAIRQSLIGGPVVWILLFGYCLLNIRRLIRGRNSSN